MRYLIGSSLFTLALGTTASAWVGETDNGIHYATNVVDEMNEISVICDAGFNAPITSINFVVDGVVPEPDTLVFLQFDQDKPLFIQTDVEGAIASATAKQAREFNQVVAGLKEAAKVKIRLFDGSSQVFSLRGSTEAIGADCRADYDRYQLALN
ncbi:MAG: hypothetical protein AAF429_09590 [Pseudomonadota bacterium]